MKLWKVKTKKYPKRCTNLQDSLSYCVPTMSKIMPFLFNSKPPHLQRCWRINQIRGSAVRIGASHWNVLSLRNLHFHFSIFFTVPFFPIRFVLFQRPCFNPFSKKKGMFHCTSQERQIKLKPHAYLKLATANACTFSQVRSLEPSMWWQIQRSKAMHEVTCTATLYMYELQSHTHNFSMGMEPIETPQWAFRSPSSVATAHISLLLSNHQQPSS